MRNLSCQNSSLLLHGLAVIFWRIHYLRRPRLDADTRDTMILPLHAYEAFRHVRLTASTSLFTSQVTEIRMSDIIPSPPLAYSLSGDNTSHHVVSIRLSGVCLQQEAGDVLSRYDGLVEICLFAIFLASSPYICHFVAY